VQQATTFVYFFRFLLRLDLFGLLRSKSLTTSEAMALIIASASFKIAAAEPSSRLVGCAGADPVTIAPWVQPTSIERRSNFGQSVGQRHGASGARSNLQRRTVSPLLKVRLSKWRQSLRIDMGKETVVRQGCRGFSPPNLPFAVQ